jgi:uncharacterized membrane protein YfcA
VCWRHAISFTIAALPGIALGTFAGDALPDTVLLVVFALVMLAAARSVWQRAGRETPDRGPARTPAHRCGSPATRWPAPRSASSRASSVSAAAS